MTTPVLVVDGDREVLAGMRRALYRFRDRFEWTFAGSAEEARAALEHRDFAVAVIDPSVPDVHGGSLLDHLREHHSATVRVAFSATCDAGRCVDALALAHRFVSKPCAPEQLVAHLAESLEATGGCLPRVAATLRAMAEPRALPGVHRRLLEELCRPEPSLRALADIVVADVGVTTRLLKLANSAWFAAPRPISRLDRAMAHLGLETVRAAVLLLGVSSMLGDDAQLAVGIAEHGLEVGALASNLVTTGPAPALRTAALLHDIGRLGFAGVAPTEYQAMVDGCTDEASLVAAETARFGGDHAQCGGFLLGLWGLPQEVVDLVSRHHDPLTVTGPHVGPLEALQLAELALAGRLAAWVDAAGDPELRSRRAALAARTQPPQERPIEAARHAILH